MQLDLFAPRPAPLPFQIPEATPMAPALQSRDFAHIPGHETAKRALTIALVGDHQTLLIGTEAADVSALQAAAYAAAAELDLPQPFIAWAEPDEDENREIELRADLCPDPRAGLGPHGETTAEIVRCVAAARVVRSEWEAKNEDAMNEPAARLLAQALEAWGRTTDGAFRARIVDVAKSIACLAIVDRGGPFILNRVNIAEALAYGRTPKPRQ